MRVSVTLIIPPCASEYTIHGLAMSGTVKKPSPPETVYQSAFVTAPESPMSFEEAALNTRRPVLISAGDDEDSITSRYFTPRRCHSSHAATGAIGVATAFALPGTVASAASLKAGLRRVVVPSLWVRDAVIERYGVHEHRVVAIPQGADDTFGPVMNPDHLRDVRCRYFGHDRPFILFVGKCSPRRNVPLLIRAFAALKHERKIPHGLLLFGPNQYDLPLEPLCRELAVTGDVVQTDGRIAQHSEMIPIYSAAEVFVHPSSIEGWSMTTAEAMACGTAVVAANRGGLGELARGYARTVDDLSVDSLAAAIGAVIEDGDLRLDLERLSLKRASSLRWQAIAARTLEVVREAATE